jgi:hypothetical protein
LLPIRVETDDVNPPPPLLPPKKGPTLKPNSLKLDTHEDQNSFYVGLPNSFEIGIFERLWASPSHLLKWEDEELDGTRSWHTRCASHWACTMLIKFQYINQGPLLSTMRSLLILSSHPSSWQFVALVQCTCEARSSFLGCPFNKLISSVGVCFVVCRTQTSHTVGP